MERNSNIKHNNLDIKIFCHNWIPDNFKDADSYISEYESNVSCVEDQYDFAEEDPFSKAESSGKRKRKRKVNAGEVPVDYAADYGNSSSEGEYMESGSRQQLQCCSSL